MSDFLTHLASRAVAPVPAVRPLVRSPYEPQTVDEFNLPEVLAAPAIQGFQSLRTERAALTPDCKQGIIDGRDAPHLPQPVNPAPARVRETSPAIVAVPVQLAARLKPLGESIPHPLGATSVSESHSPANLVPAPVVVTNINSKPIDSKPIAPPVIAPVAPETPSRVEVSVPVIPNMISPAAMQPEHRPPVAAPLPSLRAPVQSVPQIFPRSSPARPVAAAAPQPASQVTVTIGRVEIRAAARAVQAPLPATNSGPPLSLDSYLRQRASRSA